MKSGSPRAEVRAAATEQLVQKCFRLLADLQRANPWIYWTDLVLSALVGWASLVAGAAPFLPLAVRAGLFVLATISLYRAALFIHEVTHLRRGAVPGFTAGWNLLVGVPLLLPSFLYVGVHLDHHRRSVYGTAKDPEYLPLAHGGRWKLLLFVAQSLLVPILLFLRFLVVGPLSLLHPRLRKLAVERLSALAINPAFRRQAPRSVRERAGWIAQESACFAWSATLVGLAGRGVLPWPALLYGMGVATAITFVNQVRTMVAHRFENGEGHEMTIDEQLLDTVNVPGHPIWTELWAPVGLRYHALHHYLAAIPYHALGTAHRRLMAALPEDAAYRRTIVPGLLGALRDLLESVAAKGAHGPAIA